MIWALLIGYFAFGDWPGAVVLGGAGLVLFSTWIVYRMESGGVRSLRALAKRPQGPGDPPVPARLRAQCRAPVAPRARPLIGGAHTQNHRLVKWFANHLHGDRQAFGCETATDRHGRVTGDIKWHGQVTQSARGSFGWASKRPAGSAVAGAMTASYWPKTSALN